MLRAQSSLRATPNLSLTARSGGTPAASSPGAANAQELTTPQVRAHQQGCCQGTAGLGAIHCNVCRITAGCKHSTFPQCLPSSCAQDVQGSAEDEYRPPSPKYDERNFFMSTQNPWVAHRPAASPGKRSPAAPRGAAFATPPMFADAAGSGTAKRARTDPGTQPQPAPPDQQVQRAAEAVPLGDAGAAARAEVLSRKALNGVRAAPVPLGSKAFTGKPEDPTPQRRAGADSQVCPVNTCHCTRSLWLWRLYMKLDSVRVFTLSMFGCRPGTCTACSLPNYQPCILSACRSRQ